MEAIAEIGSITWFFYPILFIVAFAYGAVGHGGASGYLAILSLMNFAVADMRASALLLNLFVAGMAFYQYWRAGHFRGKLFLMFALASVPMAFLGGRVKLDAEVYRQLLGVVLLLACIHFIFRGNQTVTKSKATIPMLALLVGACIGFASGVIGIGGGVLLSPLILFLGWANFKETAAVSALFIWVNSAAGLAGQFSIGASFHPDWLIWVLIALTGGTLGSWSGAHKITIARLRYLLVTVLLIAGLKLIFL